jgi:aminoglycoside phosphotransferase
MVLANADPIKENFQFLMLELQQQIKRASLFLVSKDVKAAVTLVDHNDYILNITTTVKNHCIKNISFNADKHEVLVLRNIYDIANAFSNIGSTAVELLRHTSEDDLQCLHEDAHTEQLFATTIKAIKKTESIFDAQHKQLGSQLSDIAEQMQDDISEYADHINELKTNFSQETSTNSLAYVIAMFTNIALNIVHLSESVLSIEQDKIVTIRQFQALKSTLKSIGGKEFAEEASFDRVGETKSGCSIVAVSADKTSSDYFAIFKEGEKEKIKEEKELFETWNKRFPGMAPKVFSYKKKGRSAGILVEYLKGKTFEQLLLAKNRVAIDMALDTLCKTLEDLWQMTKNYEQPHSAQYVSQIKKRLPSVLRVHPEYDEPKMKLGNHKVLSFRKLLDRCEFIEDNISTPFNVFTHGDFNIDNVIFDSDNGQPRFIDLHRSKDTDYLQDVSVFMISNYRIKVVDPEIRCLINRVMVRFYHWVKNFAEENNDHSFHIRLCLGMARSYITSTRFSLDETHADNMFMRGHYLLEKLANTPNQCLHDFKLPTGIFYG